MSEKTRRRVLRSAVSGVGILSISAGCLGEGEENDPGGNDGKTVGEFSIPNPVIQSVDTPNVEVSGAEEVTRDNDEKLMKATLTNTGSVGEVVIEGYWVPEEIDSMSEVENKSNLQQFSEEIVTFDEDESISYNATGNVPDGYDVFIYHTTPLEAEVVVVNNGGAGEVIVTLQLNSGEKEKVINMEKDGEQKISFELPRKFNTVNEIPVGARPVETE